MKTTRVFALMIIAALIGAAALAGTASDIDNCCFVDRQCVSDQQWIDGYWAFQNKQCAAPAQPAQSQPVASGPPPAQVDNCCYVDRQCGNDQQWIDGYWAFQNNQCAAPAQPAQSQPVASGPPPAQVDNCCYVDRQCVSDLDWIGGWHAYQNNLCGATTQAGAPSSSQQASGVILRTATGIVYGHNSGRSILPTTGPSILPAPGQIISRNNCCEENWQCNNDQDWAAGYQALQNRQCALPGLISIVGPPYFVEPWERALDLLRTRLPHRYNYVLDGVDKVEQNEEHGGAGINAFRRTFFVGQGGFYDPRNRRVEVLSTVLVHEACHVHRHYAGFPVRNGCDRIREEAFCTGMQVDVLIELNVEHSLIETYRNLAADIRSGEYKVSDEGC